MLPSENLLTTSSKDSPHLHTDNLFPLKQSSEILRYKYHKTLPKDEIIDENEYPENSEKHSEKLENNFDFVSNLDEKI